MIHGRPLLPPGATKVEFGMHVLQTDTNIILGHDKQLEDHSASRIEQLPVYAVSIRNILLILDAALHIILNARLMGREGGRMVLHHIDTGWFSLVVIHGGFQRAGGLEFFAEAAVGFRHFIYSVNGSQLFYLCLERYPNFSALSPPHYHPSTPN